MDVFRQRLEDEYDANIIVTAPTVPYKGLSSDHEGHIGTNTLTVVYRDRTVIVSNPTDFPDIVETSQVREVQEPIVNANIIVPEGLSANFETDSAKLNYLQNIWARRWTSASSTERRMLIIVILKLRGGPRTGLCSHAHYP